MNRIIDYLADQRENLHIDFKRAVLVNGQIHQKHLLYRSRVPSIDRPSAPLKTSSKTSPQYALNQTELDKRVCTRLLLGLTIGVVI